MLRFIASMLLFSIATGICAQSAKEKEKAVKAYYSGFENKDAKIKSIEVFFGAGSKYPGNKE